MKKIFILLALLSTLSAQEFVIKNFKHDKGDVSARVYSKKDVNGEVCAIIKVRSGLKDVNFHSNQLSDLVKKTGEYWLYVSPGIRYLEIMKEGFAKKGYQIPLSIESQHVYTMLLGRKGGTDQQQAAVTGAGSFYIVSEPEGADIWIDDEPIEGQTPLIVENLSSGDHKIFLQKDKYTAEKIAEIKPSDVTRISLELTMASGQIKVFSRPYEANIFLDGKPKGKTPTLVKQIVPGKHTLRIEKDQYVNYEKEITVQKDSILKIDDELKKMANLSVSSKPNNVETLFNDNNYTTPFDLAVAPGNYQLSFSKKDFVTQNKDIELIPGETRNIEINLIPQVDNINKKIQISQSKRNLWLGSTLLTGALGITFKYLSDKHYEEYQNTSSEAEDLHNLIKIEDTLYPVSFGMSAICLIPTISHYIKINNLRNKLEFAYQPGQFGIAINLTL